jgi:signal transduction histidine kinase
MRRRRSAEKIIGVTFDITDHKELQQQKDDFIGIASHELKTPVTSIKAYTQLLGRILLQKGDSLEAAMVTKMDNQITRLTKLIGDLLDVTKINSGKLQFNEICFDLNALTCEIVEELQRTTETHRLIETVSTPVMVFADPERIGQVMTNLITNAIKYSPAADKILINTYIKNSEIVFCVQDFGIGISVEKQEKVFEQFYRVSGDMQHTFPGLGLGLYIAAQIIKRARGNIWLESQEGEGATFCFSLPIQQP